MVLVRAKRPSLRLTMTWEVVLRERPLATEGPHTGWHAKSNGCRVELMPKLGWDGLASNLQVDRLLLVQSLAVSLCWGHRRRFRSWVSLLKVARLPSRIEIASVLLDSRVGS